MKHAGFSVTCAKLGFTLIELLIAIAILGILMAGVLVAVNPVKRQNQAKDAQIKSDIGQISTGAQSFFASQGVGSYPVNLNALVTSGDLKNVPTPPNAVSYTYAIIPAGCTGDLASQCTAAAVSNALLDPAVTGNVWCWQSSTGKAQELAAAACAP